MDVHDANRLKELQALPLDRKIGFTAARIAEFYNHFNGRVHVAFSGGNDSTVLLYIARKLFPDIKAVFEDTGLEYPEIRAFVKQYKNVDWIKPEKSFLQVIQEYGYPVISKEVAQEVYEARKGWQNGLIKLGLVEGKRAKSNKYNFPNWGYLVDKAPFKISHMCCKILKKGPSLKYAKEHNSYSIVGTMAEESLLRRQAWIRHGCNAFNTSSPHSTPLAFWTNQDILTYIRAMNIPICPLYGEIVEDANGKLRTTKAERTGCMFCMFGIQREREPNRFQRMFYTHPVQWKYCMEKLGIRDVLNFLNVPCEPEQDLFPETFK